MTKFIFLLLLVQGVAWGQQIQTVKDPYADTVFYKAIFLQASDATVSPRMSTTGDGTFSVYQSMPDGQTNGSGVLYFVGMTTPIMAFKSSDTSRVFNLVMPSTALYPANVSVYFRPVGGQISADTVLYKSANYTATARDATICMSAAAATDTLTLPAANSFQSAGAKFTIKKIDPSGNVVRVVPSGSDKIDSAAVYNLATQYKYVQVISDGGTQWYVIGSN